MLIEEAIWIGEKLKKICAPGSKLLNIGSSNLTLRTVLQPHINNYVFKPLEKAQVEIIHTDIQADLGVDLVGDLTDITFNSTLKNLGANCLLCSNLLEHIEEKKIIIDAIDAIVPQLGYCLLTVPHNYPYHLDPIDTMYRPTIKELADLFPEYNIINSECVVASRINGDVVEKNYFQMLKNNPLLALRLLTRSLFPFYKYNNWKITIRDLSRMFKDFQVSCVLLQKK